MIALNEQQQAAVTAADGPTLVLAGAGSGKTRVIIERLAWLVEERGIDQRHLLAMTFTNRAAAEMSERLAARLGVDRVGAWVGTFHSFGLYVLRRDMDRLGRPKRFTVFDAADQLSLMKRLVRELSEDYEPVTPRQALNWISQLKQQGETPEPEEEVDDPAERSCTVLWRQYHATLHRIAAVDFDDLLVLPAKLLKEHADLRERYQRRYRYVMIDEYQDTNRAQYQVARLLSEGHGNIFAVGDEDQSIYSWRGADINNILDFAKDFPEAAVIRLEQNYRSTKPILDAANNVVRNNVNRLGKNLWTAATKGDRVRFFRAEDGDDEASFVANDMGKRGLPPGETAVLYRTNAQSRAIEQALRMKGQPYTLIGGTKFYSRKETKDILAYLRLLVNPLDDESMRRIINVPARGIGGVSLERIEDYAKLRGACLMDVLREIEGDETLGARARSSAQKLVHTLDDMAMRARTEPVGTVVEALLEEVGYRSYVEQSDEKDAKTRIELIDEFVASCTTFDRQSSGNLESFLQDLALMTDVDDFEPGRPVVTLMTCHSAKGLEFDHVYLIGMEEGLLPYGVDFDSGSDIEEERRLCYVAMTRARKSLTLTAATSRVTYGRTQDARVLSRFLDEVGTGRIENVNTGPAATTAARKRTKSAPMVDTGRIKTGTRVRHAKFGPGYVMYTTGAGDKLKARIRFKTGRTAVLMLSQAPLEILEGK